MRLTGAAAALVLVAMVASGCTPESDVEPSPPPPSEQALPAKTPEPSPTPTPFVPDCRNIVSDATLEILEAEGFVLIEEHENDLRVEHRVETKFFDNGGVDCLWGIAGGGDQFAAFGYSEISPVEVEAAQSQLADAGYARSDDGDDVIYRIDPSQDVMGAGDVFLFTDDAWYHSTTREAIDEMRQHLG